MRIEGIGFGLLGISSSKWCSHSASSPILSSVINSYFIVDLAITICFENIHETVAVKPRKILIFLKNGKNSKIAKMVQGSLEIFLDLG